MFFKIYIFKDFIYLFLEKREGREGEKHQRVVASRAPPTGDLACNPGMCPDWESNWQPFGSQACTQSTEPYQPGLEFSVNSLFLSFRLHFANVPLQSGLLPTSHYPYPLPATRLWQRFFYCFYEFNFFGFHV